MYRPDVTTRYKQVQCAKNKLNIENERIIYKVCDLFLKNIIDSNFRSGLKSVLIQKIIYVDYFKKIYSKKDAAAP